MSNRIGKSMDYPRNFVAEVEVHFRDGSSQSIFVDQAKGMPGNPFSPDEHQTKLLELTRDVIGSQQAARLFELVDRLDAAMPVQEITRLLRPA